ncbi:MAG: hypothetical protein ACOC4J_01590 [Bacteroidota bacterium]
MHEAVRQDMLEESADEFPDAQSHGPDPVVSVLFIGKSYGLVLNVDDSAFSDGCPEDIRSRYLRAALPLPAARELTFQSMFQTSGLIAGKVLLLTTNKNLKKTIKTPPCEDDPADLVADY